MGITEIIVLLVVGFIVLGPEKLPEVLRMAGKLAAELRAASNTLVRELTEAVEQPKQAFMDFDPFKLEDKPNEASKPGESPPKP